MTSVSPTPSPPNRDLPGSQPGARATAEPDLDGAVDDQPTIVNPDVIDLRTSRLAELVAGLTGCERAGALHAIRSTADAESDDALAVVARAMVDVDQPPPEGFRVAGFLRIDLPLAHHGSLRRWDRGEAGNDRPDRAGLDGDDRRFD